MKLDPKKRFPVYRNESTAKKVDRFLSAPRDSWMTEEDIAAFMDVPVEEVRRFIEKMNGEIKPAGTIDISELE